MHTTPCQTLPAQGILTVHKPLTVQLRVISGCVWLTESHDPIDHFWQAGDSFCLHSDRAVIEAQQDSLIALTPAAQAPRSTTNGHNTQVPEQTQVTGMAAPWWKRVPEPLAGLFQRPFKG
ncbi:DUF2917 domain-containing protein [Limnohabitans sp. DM1]|uniref:DUF2917 domain-containing protein n=1 Tax=Limnohabitans sp. DM1 TaxID=1597955 RepID=UPI000A672770|nr:DUF2917 domain-containing protein [Limnohabitans sp. DM1]